MQLFNVNLRKSCVKCGPLNIVCRYIRKKIIYFTAYHTIIEKDYKLHPTKIGDHIFDAHVAP